MKKFVLIISCIILSNSVLHAQNDDKRIESLIAKTEMMMGGQKAFDDIKHLSWNFFNNRSLTWNKKTGDVRIDHRNENSVYLFNTETRTGKIFKNGKVLTDSDSVKMYLQDAYEQWINDSYWLIMPFKLDDPGVKTSYAGRMTSDVLEECDVLQLTFDGVGVTPANKYLVYISTKTGLVCQWDYFPNKSDAQPRFSTPWLNYKKYGKVWLSGDRGRNKITYIHVYKHLDPSVYTDFKRPSFIK